MNHHDVRLQAVDAVELADLLEFLHGWTWFHTRRAGESVEVFSAGDYTLDRLRADLSRFARQLNATRPTRGARP